MCGAHVNIYASNIVFGRGNEEKKTITNYYFIQSICFLTFVRSMSLCIQFVPKLYIAYMIQIDTDKNWGFKVWFG